MKPWWRRARVVAGSSALALVAASMGMAAYVAHVAASAPPVRRLQDVTHAEPSTIVSADGVVLATLRQDRREPLALDQISPHVIEALIATEDHRFREHHGVDWQRSLQAAWRTGTGHIEGGSTITQQLARNLFPHEIGRERTLRRKIKEFVTALRIEQAYGKDEILQAYLNSVPFLYNTVGIGAAARTYFDKPASELDVLESATLVGMLRGTQYFNPVLHPERARERRNLVLVQMTKWGALSREACEQLKQAPLKLRFNMPDNEPDLAPHFTAYVRKWLDEWAQRSGHDLTRDGLVIHTTLDARMQRAAEATVRQQTQALQQVADVEWSRPNLAVRSQRLSDYARAASRSAPFAEFWRTHPALLDEGLRRTSRYQGLRRSGQSDAAALAVLRADDKLIEQVREAKTRLEAGFVAIEPSSGAVKAWVGSREHDTDQFDHVAQASRQPGSTFKPIVYASAMERGISPFRMYMDMPVEVRLADGRIWRPSDMSGTSNKPMAMWEGLVYSKNTITTQVMQDAGLDNIAALARAMGITRSKLDMVPSMALGTSPVTLLELASVYATIADEGRYRPPCFINRITDRQGGVVAAFEPAAPRQVLSVDTDHKLLDMMRGVVQEGTGSLLRSRFVHDADLAGKTGTTQRNADGWFVAMHPQVVVGAWVGFNDQRVAMRSSYWGQGGHNALLLVGDFLARAVQGNWVDTRLAFASPPLMRVRAVAANADAMDDVLAPAGAGEGAGTGEGTAQGQAAADDDIVTDPAGTADDAAKRLFVNDADGDESPKSAQELGEVMRAMGRNPDTGVPVGGGP
jgi:penicillin-binding protein 1A